jgi:hypothetical protein
MPEIVADPLSPSCCRLFRRSGIEEYQPLGPDLLLPRARRVRTFREGKLRRPAGAAARHPQSQAAGARPCCPADDRAGAVGSDRPQASSVAAARRATLAAASRFDRPGGASGDRSVVVARGRGFFAGADQRSDRDRAARSRPPSKSDPSPSDTVISDHRNPWEKTMTDDAAWPLARHVCRTTYTDLPRVPSNPPVAISSILLAACWAAAALRGSVSSLR